ncbi:hypothetical protein K1719_019054 [Acacia pycnantha]|nr:hypothetical protein K1719_019054 [Acacia pycnantha]
MDLAMAAAWRALIKNKDKHWATAYGSVCARYLRAMAAKVMERKSELAKLEAIDCGKTLDEALWDMDDVAGCFEYYAGLADKLDTKQKAPISLSSKPSRAMFLGSPLELLH